MSDIFSIESSVKQIKNQYDSQDFIYRLLQEIKEKYPESSETKAYEYFSSIYEWLYHDIVLKKVSISLETRKLLEKLASPKRN